MSAKKGAMMNRKAQGGMNAAVLVAIIAGLIILYIVFLPGSERAKLVTPDTEDTGTTETTSNSLLQAFPGSLSTSGSLESEKSIPNIFLVETTNAKELYRENPFIVRNGWFDKKTKIINFGLPDLENTDNVVLSFTAKKREGVLMIKLNDVVIFENELISEIIEPVRLDKKLLKDTNVLELSTSSVGARFWTTNEYSLENVKIIGDITDTSRQESTNLFTVSESEFASVDKATLKFIPYCGNVNDIGSLEVYVNNKKLFSSVPVCDNAYRQSIPKTMLNEGENNIVFKTGKGSYSVEQIRIALEFKESGVKTYYFQVSSATFSSIKRGDSDVQLTLKFVDDNKQKRAKLDINGKVETVETTRALYTKLINSRISEGNNYVRLEPLEDMEVVELKIELA